MDKKLLPDESHSKLDRWTIHKFTAIQFLCLAILWIIKSTAIAIFFPLFIALLIPLRMAMARWMFTPKELGVLDGEEEGDNEMD